MTDTRIIATDSPAEAIVEAVGSRHAIVVTDSTVAACVLPRFSLPEHWPIATLEPGDSHKSLDAVQHLWHTFVSSGITRSSVIVAIGGGMVTDLAGFAAACFKRGVPAIYVPTTVLGAVDASVGGKTGINFDGLKNEIGAFCAPESVIISVLPLSTLPDIELRSGYAEMLKHSLLDSSEALAQILDSTPTLIDTDSLMRSLQVKLRYVAADPLERGRRKALNLGHTAGHAIESLMMERHRLVPHGYGVAWGLVVALVMSRLHVGLSSDVLHAVARCVAEIYGPMPVNCDDREHLVALMLHDKKNVSASAANFTLLRSPGHPIIDCVASPDDIAGALDIARDLLG